MYFVIHKLCEKKSLKFDYNYMIDAFPDNAFTAVNFEQLVSRTKSFQKLFGLKNGCRFLIDTFCQSQSNLNALLGVISGVCFWDVCQAYQERVEECSESADIYFLS